MKLWVILRFGLWTSFLIVPLFEMMPLEIPWTDIPNLAVFIFVTMLGWPFLECVVTRHADRLAAKASLWQRPSLRISPFKSRKPLQFWWTMAIGCMVAGCGSAAGAVLHGLEHLKCSVIWFAGGIGGLSSIWICLRIFRRYFSDSANPVANQ